MGMMSAGVCGVVFLRLCVCFFGFGAWQAWRGLGAIMIFSGVGLLFGSVVSFCVWLCGMAAAALVPVLSLFAVGGFLALFFLCCTQRRTLSQPLTPCLSPAVFFPWDRGGLRARLPRGRKLWGCGGVGG